MVDIMKKENDVKYYEYRKKETGTETPWIDRVYKGEALFHSFGIDFQELRAGVGMFSTALIELPDGTMRNIPVKLITFIDKRLRKKKKSSNTGEKRYTATIGGKTVPCTAEEWPDIAKKAFENKQKAYLVDNETKRVVGTE